MLDEVKEEEWKTINDYPNYSISSLGVIRNDTTKRIMKLKQDTKGYLIIGLTKDGIQKCFKHHQLIGLHFIPNPENYLQIDHINGDPSDNRLVNLRNATRTLNQENIRRAINNKQNSEFLGVFLDARKKPGNKRWKAEIQVKGKTIFLGLFRTEEGKVEIVDLNRDEAHTYYFDQNIH